MIAVRTEQRVGIARQLLQPLAEQGLPDDERRDEVLLVKARRQDVEGRKPAVDADLCFGCVDWYMYPRRQPGEQTDDDTG